MGIKGRVLSSLNGVRLAVVVIAVKVAREHK